MKSFLFEEGKSMNEHNTSPLDFFQKYLTVWGHSLYGGWNLHRQVPAADSGVSESVRVCTGVDSHGNPHLG